MLEDGAVVVPPPFAGEGGGGVGLAALVPGDHLNLAAVPVLALGDVQVPHAVVDQLVAASLSEDKVHKEQKTSCMDEIALDSISM